jgi:hypothetical protein
MNKNLLAFFLSCLTAAVLFSCLVLIHPGLNESAVQVQIRSDGDAHDVVDAVNALHRRDIDIQTSRTFRGESFSPTMIPFMTLVLMISTGVILFFYKLYCRWLGATPTV